MIDNIMLSNSLVDIQRFQSLENFINITKDLDGEICEIGVYKGGTARLFVANSNKNIILIDTFEGLPLENEFDNFHKKGDFNDTSIEHVINVLSPYKNYKIIKGIFPNKDINDLDELVFKIVHIDVDLYDSVYNCLEYFYPKMVKGGIMVLDDYNAPTCTGAKIATDKFVNEYNLILHTGISCQAHIIIK